MPLPDGSPDYVTIAADIGLDQLRVKFPQLTGAGITVGQVEGSSSGAQGPTAIDTEPDPSVEGHPANNTDGFFTYFNGLARTSIFNDGVIGTTSHHAGVVGNFFYDPALYQGQPTGVAPGVTHVDSYNAENYLQNLQSAHPDKVVNLSYLYTDSSADPTFDAAANAYGTVFVAAAGNGGPPGAPSDAYNVISVDTSTVPQSIGPAADGATKPDISAPQIVTSRAAPIVAGAATLLVQAGGLGWAGATAKNRADAVDFRTIKTLLLNSAEKPADYYTTAYAPTPSQPLNAEYGAGVVNIFGAVTTLYAGEVAAGTAAHVKLGAAHAAITNPGSAPPTGRSQGWTLATLATAAGQDSFAQYAIPLTNTGFTATLSWAADNNDAIDHLGLFLYNAAGTLIAQSDATASNVQQIVLPAPTAGTYTLQVLLHGSATTPLSDAYALAFAPNAPGAPVACFCAGTRILTPTGEIPVERLREGDSVVTARGRIAPIRFLGRSRTTNQPIRIRAGALDDGVPVRDLLLSPEHALALRDAAGLTLVPVHRLLNGTSIAPDPLGPQRYFHIELDRHDVLLANGLPCESYLDTGNRGLFDNAGIPRQLHPDQAAALHIWATRACAPLTQQGPRLHALHASLLARVQRTENPNLRIQFNDRPPMTPETAPGRARLLLPPQTTTLRFHSNSFTPHHLNPDIQDHRRLGLPITAIRHAGADIPLESLVTPHPIETAGPHRWRWTDGSSALALSAHPMPTLLELEFLPGLACFPVADAAIPQVVPIAR